MAQMTQLEQNIVELASMGYDAVEIADLVECIAPDEVQAIIDSCRDKMFDQMVAEWLEHEPTSEQQYEKQV